MYTDLCLRASLYSSFSSGKGLFGDLLTLVLSSLISKRPVFDFWRAATMTLLSVVKDFSLGREYRCFNKYPELKWKNKFKTSPVVRPCVNTNDLQEHAFFVSLQYDSIKMETVNSISSLCCYEGLVCLSQHRCHVSPQ